MKNFFFFLHLFIHLFIWLFMFTIKSHQFLFYCMDYNLLLTLFVVHIFTDLATESHFKMARLSFWYISIIVLNISLLSDTTLCSSFIMQSPRSSHRTKHFSKEFIFFYWRPIFKNQDVVDRCAYFCWCVIASRPFWGQS